MKFKELCEKLEASIQSAYEEGVTVDQAERLASEFLYAQLIVSEELKKADLDARTRKSGVKAIKAAVYMEAATKDPKKPSDVMLQAIVDLNDMVQGEQRSFDEAEVEFSALERYYNVFQNAHVHFRNVAKGSLG